MDGTNHSRGSTLQSLSPDTREDLEHELRPEALASIAREENAEASTNTSMAPRARKEYTIQRMADDVAAVVKHVWEEGAEHHVIGHSMGGMNQKLPSDYCNNHRYDSYGICSENQSRRDADAPLDDAAAPVLRRHRAAGARDPDGVPDPLRIVAGGPREGGPPLPLHNELLGRHLH